MTRREKLKKNLLTYIVIALLLLYVFFRFGISLLVNTAFYLSSGYGKKLSASKVNVKEGSGIVIEPILEGVPHATSEATLTIKGLANPDAAVELYQNSKKIETAQADYEGNFEFSVILEEQDNDLYVRTRDDYKKKWIKSNKYTVVYLSKAPDIEITNAEDGKRVYQSDFILEGKTKSEVFVRVNGAPVIVRADGTFAYTLNLKSGDNALVVEAQDVAGNVTKKELKIIFVE